jgi:hypothetical protein
MAPFYGRKIPICVGEEMDGTRPLNGDRLLLGGADGCDRGIDTLSTYAHKGVARLFLFHFVLLVVSICSAL